MGEEASSSNGTELNELLTDEQAAQLCRLLSLIMANGWGIVEIEVKNHRIKFFRIQQSFPAE